MKEQRKKKGTLGMFNSPLSFSCLILIHPPTYCVPPLPPPRITYQPKPSRAVYCCAVMTAKNPKFFAETGKQHDPDVMWIGCCDARVPANLVVNQSVRRLFVHRNIANQVVPDDANCMSAIVYAVTVLKVKSVVVCGHYDCGGVRAALGEPLNSENLENWISHIREVRNQHAQELEAIQDPNDRVRFLVERNVIQQCKNILKLPVVEKRRLGGEEVGDFEVEPHVHGVVYEPTTGKLTRLNLEEELGFWPFPHQGPNFM